MLTARNEIYVHSWRSGGGHGENIGRRVNDIYIDRLPRELGAVRYCVVKSIMITAFAHQISMELSVFDRVQLIKRESTKQSYSLMRANELRNSLRLFSVQQYPWLWQSFSRWGAPNICLQVFGCRVTSIVEWNSQVITSDLIGIGCYEGLRSVIENESALAYYIVISIAVCHS